MFDNRTSNDGTSGQGKILVNEYKSDTVGIDIVDMTYMTTRLHISKDESAIINS